MAKGHSRMEQCAEAVQHKPLGQYGEAAVLKPPGLMRRGAAFIWEDEKMS